MLGRSSSAASSDSTGARGALARAKVNLFLSVLPPRDDGYHSLVTLFLSISLSDRLTLVGPSRDGRHHLEVDGGPRDLGGRDNLVLRAARLFTEARRSTRRWRFSLRKDVPVQAGLGGGSADAAAALVLLNERSGRPFDFQGLCELGATLGADVPFMIRGGLALGTSRGDVVEQLAPPPSLGVVVAKPDAGMDTAWAYRALDERRQWGSNEREDTERARALAAAVGRGDLVEAASLARNDFQHLACERVPAVSLLLDELSRAGAHLRLLCGSGSAVFGLFSDSRAAAKAAEALPAWTWSGVVAPCGVELLETIVNT